MKPYWCIQSACHFSPRLARGTLTSKTQLCTTKSADPVLQGGVALSSGLRAGRRLSSVSQELSVKARGYSLTLLQVSGLIQPQLLVANFNGKAINRLGSVRSGEQREHTKASQLLLP